MVLYQKLTTKKSPIIKWLCGIHEENMPSSKSKQTLSIYGMHCASCVAGIEQALMSVPEVVEANVSFVDGSAVVVGDVDENALIAAVASQGYEAKLQTVPGSDMDEQAAIEAKRFKRMLIRFMVAGVCGFGLMIASWVNWLPDITPLNDLWVGIGIVSLLILAFCGGHFYNGAWQALKHGKANMDSLIAMGTGAAWLYSMLVILAPKIFPSLALHAYFETALIIVALINLGQALELRAKGKTSQAIKRLIGLQPKTVRIVRDDQEIDIPIEDVQINDVLRVRPGEKIAVDGIIIEGNSYIDESMLSGEPIPVAKNQDDEVSAGTINKEGSFLFKATRVGKETALAQIIEMVKQAQGSKPAIGRLVDKIAGVFVPAVIIIALVAAVCWFLFGPVPTLAYALVVLMTVLLIACPCALGLAIPISIMIGVGKAAEKGILIRNGEALQTANKLTAIILDKTGTITEGKPAVANIITTGNYSNKDVLQMAASVEKGSEHPLAEAMLAKALEEKISLQNVNNFQAIAGHGVQANVDNKTILFGNDKLMKKNNISIEVLMKDSEKLAAQGETPVYIAVDNELAGIISITDPIKPEAKNAIAKMKAKGLKVFMVTGDNKNTARAVAKQINIDGIDIMAEVLPQDKAKKVAKLQDQHEIVAMVGDGINDAPALAQANVGFAIGSGADVAMETADIVLMRTSLDSVVIAIDLSHVTLKNIKQNLFGAFIYNSLGIPIAAGVLFPFIGWLLSPVFAGAAMALSSLTVVSNASRLHWYK